MQSHRVGCCFEYRGQMYGAYYRALPGPVEDAEVVFLALGHPDGPRLLDEDLEQRVQQEFRARYEGLVTVL
ncbi:hypothetical protein [Alicyclobacillus contaminans]|uniref:hypothetical protein n=1 Tax=Alicyclobacillus contaminans TaxID=392016 RepID=UPI00047CD67B|nr:hypothetical protein [Alicyclobacillus contaminans]